MKKVIILLGLLFFFIGGYGQKYKSEKGQITFFSDGAIEDITAENTGVGSMFNASTGDLVFIVAIIDFKFSKSLMREHFNEKYMETDLFPRSTFQGRVTGFDKTAKGEQKVKAVGKLTMHGVTKDVEAPGVLEINEGHVTMKSKFIVLLKDYNIKIPTIVWQNIAEKVEVKIDFTYKAL